MFNLRHGMGVLGKLVLACSAVAFAVAHGTGLGLAQEPVTLKVHDWSGPQSVYTRGYQWWAEEVTARTNGAVKFEFFWNESLGKQAEQPDGLRSGLFDLGGIYPPVAPAKTPLWNVVTLPGTSEDVATLAAALTEISTIPALVDELKRWNVRYLFPIGTPGLEYMGIPPIHKAEDFAGKRIRAQGEFGRLLSNLGAVPVSIPGAESFDAVQRGTIDGSLFTWPSSHGVWGTFEVAKHATIFGLGGTAFPWVIREAAWERLDPQVQQVMLEVAKEVPGKYIELLTEADAGWLEKFAAAGIEIYDAPAEERAKIQAASQPIWDAWAKTLDDQGQPGTQIKDAWIEAVRSHTKSGN